MVKTGGMFTNLRDANQSVEIASLEEVRTAPERTHGGLSSFASAMMGIPPEGKLNTGSSTISETSDNKTQTSSLDFATAWNQTAKNESSASSTNTTETEHLEKPLNSDSETFTSPESQNIFAAQNLQDEKDTVFVRAAIEKVKQELLIEIARAKVRSESATVFQAEETAAKSQEVSSGIYYLTYYSDLLASVVSQAVATWANPQEATSWEQQYNHKRRRKSENQFAAMSG